jgi:hypothetical protein
MTFDEFQDLLLVDLLTDTNLSMVEIATELVCSEGDVRKRIKELGLGWIRRQRGFASRGQASLTQALRKLLPGEEIRTEEHIGERLKLDVYCPRYNMAAEFHGRQHFEYNSFFHNEMEDFHDSVKRDERKQQICNDLGIVLVVFRYNDDLSEDAVFNRLIDAIKSAPPTPVEEKKSTWTGPYYDAMKKRQKEYRKKMYDQMKKGQRGI